MRLWTARYFDSIGDEDKLNQTMAILQQKFSSFPFNTIHGKYIQLISLQLHIQSKST